MEGTLGGQSILCRIPLEVRYRIYDFVAQLDIDNTQVAMPDRMFLDPESSEEISRSIDTELCLPWIDLRLTCRAVNTELVDYIGSLSTSDVSDNRTYTVDIDGATHMKLGYVVWRRVPCCPFEAKALVANINFRNGHCSLWGDGGPNPILSQLYQTLNSIVHYGPRVNRKSPLPEPMKLKQLVVNVNMPFGGFGRKLNPIGVMTGIYGLLGRLGQTGVLFGYIDNIRIVGKDGHYEDISPTQKDNPAVPLRWVSYGFGWGAEFRLRK
ncbi:hypothetical protein BX600DRAFT_516900 [Xylariales sp. PMI_506]|nr:hypothetical protein BX600DRAFT_516900 [Xylariales sp. PMI_506]